LDWRAPISELVSAGRAQAAALTLESVGTEAIVFRIWDAIW